jgi:hypothetical protein
MRTVESWVEISQFGIQDGGVASYLAMLSLLTVIFLH